MLYSRFSLVIHSHVYVSIPMFQIYPSSTPVSPLVTRNLFSISVTLCLFFFSHFLKYKFIYFNWRLITLQYCIGFTIHQHESATGVHVFPILNLPLAPYHPSGSSQCTSPKHPVSCIEPVLAIHFIYGIIHVSMTFS